MSPIQIAEAFDIIALILAIILLLVCMLEFRYMDDEVVSRSSEVVSRSRTEDPAERNQDR